MSLGAKPHSRAGHHVRGSHPIRVDLLTTLPELETLLPEWSFLVDQSPSSTVFLTWEWVRIWWRHFGEGAELFILTARAPDDTLVGVAPWMRTHHGIWPLRVRVLSFIGKGTAYPAHLDVLAVEDEIERVATAFVAFIHSPAVRDQWDCLEAHPVSDSSVLDESMKRAPGTYFEFEKVRTSYVPLSRSMDFETDALDGKVRREIRRNRRALERDHGDMVAMRYAVQPHEADSSLDALFALHKKRWSSKGFSSSLDDTKFASFLREFTHAALQREWLRMWWLEVGSQTLAVNLCFCIRDVVYGYQKAFDPDWRSYSPGRLVQLEAFQSSASKGMRELDMLVQDGTDPQWPVEHRYDVSYVYAQTWRGTCWALCRLASARLRRRIARRLPKGLKRRLERLLSG